MELLNRRNFLSNSLALGATVAAVGSVNARNKLTGFIGAPMQGFADKPMKNVRVGIVGIGYRGVHAVDGISQLPNTSVVALCDLHQERVDHGNDVLNILPRYTSTDKICRIFVNYKKVRRKTVFQFVKMIIRLLSHTFFILTFITSSAIFENFENLQILEIRSFRNIRMLSLAFGIGIANLRKTKSYLRLIIGLSSGKALDK